MRFRVRLLLIAVSLDTSANLHYLPGNMGKQATLGDRLRVARESAGLGCNELERVAGLKSCVSRIERGERMAPRYDTVTALAHALGIRAEWLATGEGPMRREAS